MERISDEKLFNYYLCKQKLDLFLDAEMVSRMELYQLMKGESLCNIGEELNYMYFLVKGKLRITTTQPNGKSLLLMFYNPLSIIGDIEFTTNFPVRVNVESVCMSHLIRIDFRYLEKSFEKYPEFLRYILKTISYKLYSLSNYTSINLLYPVENRFASYIISNVENGKKSMFIDGKGNLKLTDIAELLGTSYRHLNRVIQKLCNLSIISRSKESIVIINEDKLNHLTVENIYEKSWEE